MPRLVSERLEGYAFAVAQQAPANGNPDAIVDELVFLDDPAAPRHTVVIPLTAQGKRALIRHLSGVELAAPTTPHG